MTKIQKVLYYYFLAKAMKKVWKHWRAPTLAKVDHYLVKAAIRYYQDNESFMTASKVFPR